MFNHLGWDTDFFGFRVARITARSLNPERLKSLLNRLKSQNYRLAYWFISPSCKISNLAAQSQNGYLADEKTSLYVRINDVIQPKLDSIKEYLGDIDNPELLHLAYQSGQFSRFKKDPIFPLGKFEELYRIWINRSIKREIADTVFIHRKANKMYGLATVSVSSHQGHIGLFSVDSVVRGQGIGKELMAAIKYFLFQRGICSLGVTTQGENKEAISFYKKCGFHIKNVKNVYHFWL